MITSKFVPQLRQNKKVTEGSCLEKLTSFIKKSDKGIF